MSPAKPHVLIIGAGIAGLFFAQILRKKGISFEIFDKLPGDRPEAGLWPKVITLHSVVQSLETVLPDDLPPIRQTLDLCHKLGLETQSCLYLGDAPRVGVINTPKTLLLHINHIDLLKWLATNLKIAKGKQASKIEETGDKVTVTFEDGTSATGDFLVGADGVDSFVRESLLGVEKAQQLDGSVIHATVTLSGEALQRQLALGHASCIMPTKPNPVFDAMYAALIEVHPDGKSARYSWQLCEYEHGPDPEKVGLSKEQIRQRALEVTKHIPARCREIIEQTPPEGIEGFAHYKDAKVEEIPAGRITLIGDAAHTSAPFKGDGAVQAFRDAIRLGNALALVESTDKEAFVNLTTSYHDEMIPRNVAAVRAAKAALSEYTNLLSRPRVFGNRFGLMHEEKITLTPEGSAKIEICAE